MILEFLNKGYLDDNCQAFFNLMFNCPDKTSRFYIGKMTSTLINKIYYIYQNATVKDAPKIVELVEEGEKFIKMSINALKTQDC